MAQSSSCEGDPSPQPVVTGEDGWKSLEGQLKSFIVHHAQGMKVLASLAQEQSALLVDLDTFVKDHIDRPLLRPSPPVAQKQRPRGDSADDLLAECRPQSEQRKERWRSDAAVAGDLLAEHNWTGGEAATLEAPSAKPEELQDERRRAKSARFAEDAIRTSQASSASSSLWWGALNRAQHYVPQVELADYNNFKSQNTNHQSRESLVPPMSEGWVNWARGWGDVFLSSRFFEPLMGIVIALNAANIGWAIDRELRNDDTDQQDIYESIFLCIFVVELLLRWFVKGIRCLKLPVNLFDFLLVLVTVITQVMKPLLELAGGQSAVVYLQQLMVLRMMRLLRLARAVRLIASFRSLYKLAQGLIQSLGTMVSAMVLMFITIYIFACFGAEIISKQYVDDAEVGKLVGDQFSSLPQILLTLFQFISMDGTAQIYVPLVQRSPMLMFYFLLLLVIVAIALMNLITALLVEDAISTAHMDEEMQAYYTRQRLKQLTPALRKLFQSLDKDGDGQVHIREVVESIRAGIHIPMELHEVINPARMLDLFEALDADHSGQLSESEFVDGLGCVALSDVPLETMQILHLLRTLRRDCSTYFESARRQLARSSQMLRSSSATQRTYSRTLSMASRPPDEQPEQRSNRPIAANEHPVTPGELEEPNSDEDHYTV